MNKDTKTWGILILLLLAVLFFLSRRKRVVTQVSMTLLDSMGNPIGGMTGPLRDQLNNQLTRICDYGSASLLWNSTNPCPANYNGSNLISDRTSSGV
jgi:hypothetical protein